jgi:hypothetical protein
MASSDRDKAHGEGDQAFIEGTIGEKSDEDLQRYLQALCTGHVPNEAIRHREIIRGITINHIQMSRVIQSLQHTIKLLDSENGKLSRRVYWLTVVAIFLGGGQVIIGGGQLIIGLISLSR